MFNDNLITILQDINVILPVYRLSPSRNDKIFYKENCWQSLYTGINHWF